MTLKFWKWPGMAVSFARALLGGTDHANIRARLAICKACEHLKKVPYVDDDTLRRKEKLFCGQCGCGTRPIAELHTKLAFNVLRCPVGKWGEANALAPKEASQLVAQQERLLMGGQQPQPKRANVPPVQNQLTPEQIAETFVKDGDGVRSTSDPRIKLTAEQRAAYEEALKRRAARRRAKLEESQAGSLGGGESGNNVLDERGSG